MAGQVVHHDDVAGLERWSQNLQDIGEKDRPRHGAVDNIRGDDAGQGQAGNQGRCLPMSMGDGGNQAHALAASTVSSSHFCRCGGLIEEYQSLRIKRRLLQDEFMPPLGDIRPLLLGGVQAFF